VRRIPGASGFTLVELVIAIVVLTVGLLGLVTTAALVTRMIARGHRSAVAATFAAQRLERLRAQACSNRASGSETLDRGSSAAAGNEWRFQGTGDSTYRILLVTTYRTSAGRTRADTIETSITCRV